MPFSLESWAGPFLAEVDRLLLSRFAGVWPSRLADACAYPLSTGGKRYRPMMVAAACDAVGGDLRSPGVVCAGAAVELIHTYSLVHDDLPCMDDDDVRRGRPTVHQVYGDGPARLVGDALLTDAFALLADAPLDPAVALGLVRDLTEGAGVRGMIGGQGGDIGMAGPVRDLETLLAVHRGKTGALIRAAARMGARVGGADADAMAAITAHGAAIGVAFQMADDVLDADQDEGDDGPPSYVRLLGVDETRRRAAALLQEALDHVAGLPNPEALIALARYTVERRV